MKVITLKVNLKENILQSYLNHYNDVFETDHKLSNPKVFNCIVNALAEEAEGELEMRLDDQSGFETELYFDLEGAIK